ncbi:hypothetical protein APY04_2939 [Hyphomicrobium sulfonivorans]|uniref:Uncharacterized protein n=1 Tax=Hyphomicrobium sulfonivorans TaxID=121290 RepID=A0A120CTU2_HYPSL|nr:hypothetical protein APY04_2939 [Hyphomicrobium sulfonivorans]
MHAPRAQMDTKKRMVAATIRSVDVAILRSQISSGSVSDR